VYTQLTGLPSVTEGCRVSTSSHYVSHCVPYVYCSWYKEHSGSHNECLY